MTGIISKCALGGNSVHVYFTMDEVTLYPISLCYSGLSRRYEITFVGGRFDMKTSREVTLKEFTDIKAHIEAGLHWEGFSSALLIVKRINESEAI